MQAADINVFPRTPEKLGSNSIHTLQVWKRAELHIWHTCNPGKARLLQWPVGVVRSGTIFKGVI